MAATDRVDLDGFCNDFVGFLNKSPLIMLSARKGSDWKAVFMHSLSIERLKAAQGAKSNIDFLCGVQNLSQPVDKWQKGQGAKKSEMASRTILSLDLDWKDNEDCNKESALESIKGLNPWFVMDSGNGLHIHFKTPEFKLDSPSQLDLWERSYRSIVSNLETKLGLKFDIGASSPARTMRLPGSQNWKETTPKQTEILFWNPNNLLDVNKVAALLEQNPLKEVSKLRPVSDGLKQKIFEVMNWELMFELCNLAWTPKRSGASWMVRSPFRDDRRESMSLSDDKGLYFDHGDSESKGDYIGFYGKLNGLTYKEALLSLASGLGLGGQNLRIVGGGNNKAARDGQGAIENISYKTEMSESGELVLKKVEEPEQVEEVMSDPHVDEFTKKLASKKKLRATYAQYETVFDSYFGRTERDLFSNELMYKPSDSNRWLPCASTENVQYLKGLARESDGFFNISAIEEYIEGRYYLFHNQTRRQPRFLIDVPEWDGKDRIAEIVECLPIANMDHVTAYELIMDWCAHFWLRVHNPAIQNRILIIKGPQGAGKDYLVRAMFGSLEQYLIQLTISANEKDLFEVLSSGALMHISEYDRTNRTEVGLLKHLITAPDATFRGAYQRKAVTKQLRASFIATTNDNKVLRDATGSRRYILLDLSERIKWTYEPNSLQILAQCRALAQRGYKASELTEKRLAENLEVYQPEDFEELVVLDWVGLCAKEYSLGLVNEVEASEAIELLKKVADAHKLGLNGVRAILKRAGMYNRTAIGRFYRTKLQRE